MNAVIPPGGRWSARLQRGDRLRIIDTHGQQAVDFLCFAADPPHDRYNAANTLKLARSIYVTKGTVLYSELARKLLQVTEDTCGRHDTLAGCCSAEMNELRYGISNTPNCRANFIAEMQRWGMTGADVVANVNFFMNVPVEADGSVAIAAGLSKPGDYVEMIAETAVVAMLSNCPQENNPCSGFGPTPIEVVVTSHHD